ncbi:MAG TPA: magnesium-translocating P-type ATPase [Porphyromonadaceae bacterium]|nr:magnesium-translocating P-type ATPase [Porphyromonadaceae bacterium]
MPQFPNLSQTEFWNKTADELLQQLHTSEKGLTDADAVERLKQYGANTLKKKSNSSAAFLFLLQFKSPLTLLLLVAAILSVFLGDRTDAIIIFTIVFISSFLGFWQEKGAANAVSKLLKMVQIHCSVLRNGTKIEIPVENIVPGDVVELTAGDVVPGDGLILQSKELYMDEAAFTGETYPVEKMAGVVVNDAPLAKRTNSVLMGSHVISGTAVVLIAATGKQTEFGKISSRLSGKTPETDFEHGIRRFGYMLMEITLLLVMIIFAANVILEKPILDSLLFSLALAVGLTPQLLPAIITINLSKGAREMAKKQVIVKRLSSIENFGSMNILCSDKTGTITAGKVSVNGAIDINGNASIKTYRYAWLNASLQQGFHNPIDEAICENYTGDKNQLNVLSEIPYDFIRKRLTIYTQADNQRLAITKGAFSKVVEICTLSETGTGDVENIELHRAEITSRYEALSAAGFRTLGVAYKPGEADNFNISDEKEMIFLGFVTLFDPLKPETVQTVQEINNLGVSLKIITGDNALVVKSLAKKMGIADAVIITGKQMAQMSNEAFQHVAQSTHIFAEVEPNQKERIILALKKGGNVVGFMGDGINDAPALHAADVGISVDSAVDVAKEAADIVLLASDLHVLKNGIAEGRKTFANTMKYIFMATSANFGNMFSMAGASLFLPFLPLLPKQILLTNLLTDFPEMTIATDNVDAGSISKPIRWDFRFIKRFMVTFGLISSVFDYLTFGVLLYFLKANEQLFQTGWFVESVISATLIVLVVRTRVPFFRSKPGKYLALATALVIAFVLFIPFSPFMKLFEFVELPPIFFVWMIAIVTCYIASAELAKRWFYKKMGQ